MGKHFNRLHQSRRNIYWSEDVQTINYLRKGVELGKIRTKCYSMIKELQEVMQELTFGSNVPALS
jgi:hypothetical protein